MVQRDKYSVILLALLIWSANFLCGCQGGMDGTLESEDLSKVPTITSDSLTIISSKDGVTQYRFVTPLLERYEMAEEPYMLFPKGIEIETFSDSTRQMESYLRADWATFNETKQLWEAKGNVVGVNIDGDSLYTQQIFWDQKEARVYSNVDTKVKTGGQVVLGSGFESDDKLSDITMGGNRGRFLVDVEQDSTASEAAPVDSIPTPRMVK